MAMADQTCGICLEKMPARLVLKTLCCQQFLCHHCNAADRAYKSVPSCPFCRHANYEVGPSPSEDAHLVAAPALCLMPHTLEGTWDVRVTESCKLGTSKYTVTLKIQGRSGRYETTESDSHFRNAAWNDLSFGHTTSGKSFVAKQRIARAPSWVGDASICGPAGLQGRLSGPDSAKFTSSMTLQDRESNELEIVQECEMVRRSLRETTTI